MEESLGKTPVARGRGTATNAAGRFERLALEIDPDWLDAETAPGVLRPRVRTEYFVDDSRQIVTSNDSPDIPFTFSVNPYRGCEHGCSYCYARPYHEYLGLSAGLDFESKIMVKPEAPRLLEAFLSAKKWKPEAIALSGVTDCYQPAERKLLITRGCLEVLGRFGNPVGIITKSALVTRDADILGDMARRNLARVTLSVNSLDAELARKLEPRASAPAKRLEAIATLAQAGIPVSVAVAPLIPGLNDHEAPAILKAAAEAGATAAGFIVLRLPYGVKDIFQGWLEEHYPKRADKVLAGIRSVRGGDLTATGFGTRMTGEGPRADVLERLFQIHAQRLGLNRQRQALSTQHFRKPGPVQQELFSLEAAG